MVTYNPHRMNTSYIDLRVGQKVVLNSQLFDEPIEGTITGKYNFYCHMDTNDGKTISSTVAVYEALFSWENAYGDTEWESRVFDKNAINDGLIIPER